MGIGIRERRAVDGCNPQVIEVLALGSQTCFQNQPWAEVGTSTKTRLIPRPLRERGYARIRDIADAYGIDSVICSCKNPDLRGGICVPERIIRRPLSDTGGRRDQQLTLFPC